MKLKVTKFAELSNKELTTPCVILGKNGVGKSSLMNAYLWTMIGKDKKGCDLGEAVYSVKDKEDLRIADVEVELNGTKLRKVCKPIYRNTANGRELTTLCSNTYFIDGVKANEKGYNAKVVELCGGRDFQLLSDPNYFPELKKDEQMRIVTECLNIDKASYFVGCADPKVIDTSIRNIRTQIKQYEQMRDYSKETLDGIALGTDKRNLIAELQKKQKQLFEQKPTLNEEQIATNNDIQRKIEKIKGENFVKGELIHKYDKLYSETKRNLNDLLELQNNETRRKMQNERLLNDCRKDIEYFTTETEKSRSNVDKIRKIITDYDQMKADLKCTICPICDNDFCPNKKVDLKGKSDYINDLESEQNKIAEFNAKCEDLAKKIDELQKEVYHDHTQAIQDLTDKGAELEALMKKEQEQNAMIQTQNEKGEFDFNMSKAGRIDELIQMVEVAQINPETEKEIARLQREFDKAMIAQKQYDENCGKIEILNKQVDEHNAKIEELTELHIKLLQELEKYNDAEKLYRSEVERKIKEIFPNFIDIRLFRERISGGFENCFEMSFKGKRFQNTALEIYGRVSLLQVFQKQFGCSLPIFCDDLANIVDDDLMPKGDNLVCIFAVAGESLDIMPM